MHHRGEVKTFQGIALRASVWIEQEIAIAAFIHHVLKRNIEVALYLQRGIRREGIREQLRLLPIEFERSEEVIEDLRQKLVSWQLKTSATSYEAGHLEITMEKLGHLSEIQKRMLHFILHQGETQAKALRREYDLPLERVRAEVIAVDQAQLSVRELVSAQPSWRVNESFREVLKELLCPAYH